MTESIIPVMWPRSNYSITVTKGNANAGLVSARPPAGPCNFDLAGCVATHV